MNSCKLRSLTTEPHCDAPARYRYTWGKIETYRCEVHRIIHLNKDFLHSEEEIELGPIEIVSDD